MVPEWTRSRALADYDTMALLTGVLLRLELCVEKGISGWLGRANDGGWGKPEDDKPDKSNSGRCLWLVPVGDIAHSPVSPSI